MSSAFEHNGKHLASVCAWMAGGIGNAVARGQQELTRVIPPPCRCVNRCSQARLRLIIRATPAKELLSAAAVALVFTI